MSIYFPPFLSLIPGLLDEFVISRKTTFSYTSYAIAEIGALASLLPD